MTTLNYAFYDFQLAYVYTGDQRKNIPPSTSKTRNHIKAHSFLSATLDLRVCLFLIPTEPTAWLKLVLKCLLQG